VKSNSKGFTLIELLAVIVVLAIILIIAIPAIGNIIKESRKNAYEETTEMIERAAKIYIGKNPNYLPKDIGETSEVTLQTLVESNLLDRVPKDPRNNELLEESSVVVITKTGDKKYTYEYEGDQIVDLLTNHFSINVGSSGTYELKNEATSNEAYFFVGVNPNNWIQFGKDSGGNTLMWRIIKYDDEGIKIIYEGVKNGTSAPTANGRITIDGSTTTPWDTAGGTYGSNKWERPADLKSKLATWYDSLQLDTSYINPVKWCLGGSGQDQGYPTSPVSISHFLSTECVDGTYGGGTFKGKTTEATGYGMIRASDYLSTTSSDLCTGSYYGTDNNNRDCGVTGGVSTNFLYKSAYHYWTYSAYGPYTNNVWAVDSSGYVTAYTAYDTTIGVRPVLNLKSAITYKSGSGTLADPYIVE